VASEAERQEFDGHIRCPMASAAFGQGERCGAPPYPVAVVAQHAQDTFEGFDQRRRLLQEGRLVQELQAEFKDRLEQEIARALAQGQVDQARRHIQDRILTLACPRCSQAFDSFDGCFALTCSKQGCGCARGVVPARLQQSTRCEDERCRPALRGPTSRLKVQLKLLFNL